MHYILYIKHPNLTFFVLCDIIKVIKSKGEDKNGSY